MADKKKILYIVTQAEWGGAQRYVFDLATNLAEDYEVAVAAGIDGNSQELFERLTMNNEQGTSKIKIAPLKHLVRPISPLRDLLAIFEIAKLYKTIKPNIVHLNSTKAGVLGSLAKLLLDPCSLLFVYTAHGWVYLEPLSFWRRKIYLWMEKISARLRNATIVLSEKEKETAVKYGTAKKDSIQVIANGIDFAELNFFSKSDGVASLRTAIRGRGANGTNDEAIPNIIIGTIANLYKTKGLEYLIEAIKILDVRYSMRNTKTIVIGEGPERKNLKLKIKNLKLENQIILAGGIPDARKYLKIFDIFVLPSLKEGFPYALLEAMAAGAPIVASDVGAIPEILENKKTGALVPPADPQKLAEALSFLIAHPLESSRLGLAASEAVKKFSMADCVSKTTKIYQTSFPS